MQRQDRVWSEEDYRQTEAMANLVEPKPSLVRRKFRRYEVLNAIKVISCKQSYSGMGDEKVKIKISLET
jgi:hypothetical protein